MLNNEGNYQYFLEGKLIASSFLFISTVARIAVIKPYRDSSVR
jgi:hypothetical protein